MQLLQRQLVVGQRATAEKKARYEYALLRGIQAQQLVVPARLGEFDLFQSDLVLQAQVDWQL